MSAPRPWLTPDAAPALCAAGRSASRQELAARADALAAWLAARGLGEGEVAAAFLPNGLGFAALVHAIDRAGAVLLPLNLRLTTAELAFQLRDARAGLLLHDGGTLGARADAAARAAGGVTALRLPDAAAGSPVRFKPRAGLDAPFALLYTSGTTGRPKGALLTHRNLRASVEASSRHLGVRPDDRWLACLPLFHVGGLVILLRCALHGIPALVHERFDPEAVNRALDGEAVTCVSLVPAMLSELLDARRGRPAPPTLRCVLVGGGPVPRPLLERAAALGFPIAPSYGLTEASSQVATLRPGSDPDPACAGLEPLPGTRLRILAGGRTAGPGEEGEILVRSAAVMRGYANRPQETARVLRAGWLHTGDIGRLDARGRLFVIERRSDLIASGGENVYPAEVEAALLEHPDVLEAAVAGVVDERFGQRPAAWLVLRPDCALGADELARFCRERLAGYKVPVRFERVAALPRSATGKLLRNRLAR